jgi:hypothetical protein
MGLCVLLPKASNITRMYLSGSLSAVISPPELKPIGQVSRPLFVAESMKTIAASEQERMISSRINSLLRE